METVKRLSKGVHNGAKWCGSNREGFAAIESTFKAMDVHSLSSYPCMSGPPRRPIEKKALILSQDVVVYLLHRLSAAIGGSCTVIITFTRVTPMTSALRSVVSYISSSTAVLIIEDTLNCSFLSTLHHKGSVSSAELGSVADAIELVRSTVPVNSAVHLMYPEATPQWMPLINDTSPLVWFTPVSKSCLFSSSIRDGVSYYAFPWSSLSKPCGYAVGVGHIVNAPPKERNKYAGRLNFYLAMVSCCPIGSRCTDCIAMNETASWVSSIADVKSPKHERQLSAESIHALEELDAIIRTHA